MNGLLKNHQLNFINSSFSEKMEPAIDHLKISEEKCLDPFENAPIEDLQELVFQHLTGKEVKQIYQVSPLWNEIASASKTCGDKFQLRLNHEIISIQDKLKVILNNGRKYGTLQIVPPFDAINTILLQEIVAGLGSSLKELRLWNRMKASFVIVLLRSLPNLEDLHISKISDDKCADSTLPLLPKLRKLTLHDAKDLWFELFSNITSLEDFTMRNPELTTNF